MLEITSLRISFAQKTINAHFSVPTSKSIALMGESGSGKSTILHTIAGFQKPNQGAVIFAGQNLLSLSPSQRPITLLFQGNNLFAHLNVQQNIGLGINTSLKLTKDDKTMLQTALVDVGLSGFERRLPSTLSGGQKQRVALARCLVRNKPLLLLDEPFKGLDKQRATDLMRLTKDLIITKKMTLVLATHHQDEAEFLCDEIYNL